MKRRNQNNFMPCTSNGNAGMNLFTNKRKSSLVATFSNSNQSVEEVKFVNSVSTQSADTEFFTTYDVDVENAFLVNESLSDPKFIFDATVVDLSDRTKEENGLNKEKPIISLHWADLSDYDLTFEQKPAEGQELVFANKKPIDKSKDQKPYFWYA